MVLARLTASDWATRVSSERLRRVRNAATVSAMNRTATLLVFNAALGFGLRFAGLAVCMDMGWTAVGAMDLAALLVVGVIRV